MRSCHVFAGTVGVIREGRSGLHSGARTGEADGTGECGRWPRRQRAGRERDALGVRSYRSAVASGWRPVPIQRLECGLYDDASRPCGGWRRVGRPRQTARIGSALKGVPEHGRHARMPCSHHRRLSGRSAASRCGPGSRPGTPRWTSSTPLPRAADRRAFSRRAGPRGDGGRHSPSAWRRASARDGVSSAAEPTHAGGRRAHGVLRRWAPSRPRAGHAASLRAGDREPQAVAGCSSEAMSITKR